MAMAAPMPTPTVTPRMTTDAGLLTLMQWLSPAYPVGAFAYSHGLETLIARGEIADAASLAAWLEAIILHGSGRNDAILLACAFRADDPATLAHTDATARAFCASAERLRETVQQGAAFCTITRNLHGFDLPDMAYPVAVGRAAHLAGLPLHQTTLLYLQAVTGNLVSAAVRLVPLGQTDGQKVLARLAPLYDGISRAAATATLDDLAGTTYRAEIAAMHHETLSTRIFRT